jgi:hypothetical protein
MRRTLYAVLLAALVGLPSVAVVAPASAASGTYLRLAHLSPDTPAVDVSVTSFSGQNLRLADVGYGDVSTYQQIQPGSYTVEMRLAGAPADSPAVVAGTLQAVEGGAYTAAGLGPRAELAVRILADDLTPPAAGEARIRVVQGAQEAGDVSIAWNRAPMVDRVAFGTATDYVSVPAGAGTFDVAPAAGGAVSVPVDLDAGSVYSVVVVQRDGALAAELKTDARGPGRAPAGGIETGLGGTAGDGATPLWAAGGLLLVVVGGALLRVRGRSHSG